MRDGAAIVTGASRGIGRAIAAALGREGMRLVVNARAAGPLEEEAARLRAAGIEVEAVAGDVGEEETARRLVGRAVARWGRLDVLVNNAGIGWRGRLEEMPSEEWDRVFRTNLRGPFLLAREAIPVMRRQGGGDIVNVASLAAFNPVPNLAAYAASKWGLVGFSKSLMAEVRHDSIRVIVIAPGSTRTDFGHSSEKMERGERMVAPEDVAEAVAAAIRTPRRATLSLIEVRPTVPP